MKRPTISPIRIVILESDPLRLTGFRAIFGTEPDLEVRATDIAALLQSMQDDVVLMAASNGAKFYAGMAALKAVYPTIRVIVTGPGSAEEDALRAISAGAKGYIAEDALPGEFIRAIREVHDGSVWAPRRVLATFIERATASIRRPQLQDDKISEREREVLQLLVSGCSNREIGSELGIEERTVKAHVAQLMRKMGVQNRIALSVHAITHSLLTTPQ